MKLGEKIAFWALISAGIGLIVALGIFWFNPYNVPTNFSGSTRIFDVMLYIAVTYVVWHFIFTNVLHWMVVRTLKRPSQVRPEAGLKVAFITTFVPGSEPVELLHDILPALVKADYKHDSWLLDEGASKEAEKVCKQYGVKYFTRNGKDHYNTEDGKFAARTKGGNHNAWYDAHGHEYDIVAQIDTDFIPKKNFLTATLGHFRDPDVAWVGTPQIYGNIDESFVARGAAEQSYSFYGPGLQGLHGKEMAMMLGANHVVRVAALKEIDFYGGHLTEDLLTGMTLHSQRWKSVYVPEALAFGEGPPTWSAFLAQQMRWAFGGIDVLLNHAGDLTLGMHKHAKRYYLMLLQHYFSGLAGVIGVVLMVLYFVFGFVAISAGPIVFILQGVVFLWMLTVSFWMNRFNILPSVERGLMWRGMIANIAAWPIFFLAFVGVLRGKRLGFKVTPKGTPTEFIPEPLRIFAFHMFLALATAAALVISYFNGNDSMVMRFWGFATVVTLAGLVVGVWLSNVYGHLKSWRVSRSKDRAGSRHQEAV